MVRFLEQLSHRGPVPASAGVCRVSETLGYSTVCYCICIFSRATHVRAQGTWELIEAWDDDDNAAVYWDGPKHIVSPCPEQGQPGYDPTCVPAIVTLENNEDQGYGPETLSLTGKLPDGLYRVYAMVYSGHPDSTFQAACGAARLTVYSEMNRQGPLYSYEVGQKTWLDKDGNWWQVMMIAFLAFKWCLVPCHSEMTHSLGWTWSTPVGWWVR